MALYARYPGGRPTRDSKASQFVGVADGEEALLTDKEIADVGDDAGVELEANSDDEVEDENKDATEREVEDVTDGGKLKDVEVKPGLEVDDDEIIEDEVSEEDVVEDDGDDFEEDDSFPGNVDDAVFDVDADEIAWQSPNPA